MTVTTLTRQKSKRTLKSFFPIVSWLPKYNRSWLQPDTIAALTVWALLVPEAALVYDLDGTYVWRVDEERRARRTLVELGLRQAGRVEVVEGLSAGEWVVSAGVHSVEEGETVRILKQNGA